MERVVFQKHFAVFSPLGEMEFYNFKIKKKKTKILKRQYY